MMAAAKLCYLNHLDPKTLDSVALIFQMQKQNLYATHKRSQRENNGIMRSVTTERLFERILLG